MPPTGSTAQTAAQHLLALAGMGATDLTRGGRLTAGGDANAADDAAAVAGRADQLWSTLRTFMSAWCGPDAYHALLTRALAKAQVDHPALLTLRAKGAAAPALEGLTEAARTYGAPEIQAATHALLTELIALLDRVIGHDTAVDVLSQALQALPPAPVTPPLPADAEGGV